MDPLTILARVTSSLFSPVETIPKRLPPKSNKELIQDVGSAIQKEIDEIKGSLKDEKLKDLHAAFVPLREALLTLENSDFTDPQQQEKISADLKKAKYNVDLVIKAFTSKEEAIYRVQCAKIASFFYLFQVIWFGKSKQTAFEHCLSYIDLAMNDSVRDFLKDIAYSRDYQIISFIFSTEAKQKKLIYYGMKQLIGITLELLQPCLTKPVHISLDLFIGCDNDDKIEFEDSTDVWNVKCVEFDANKIIVGCYDEIKIWDLVSGKLSRVLQGHSGNVEQIVVDGEYLISSSGTLINNKADLENFLLMWDHKITGECVRKFVGHSKGVSHICVDDRHIISRSNDREVRFWDKSNGECEKVLVEILNDLFIEGNLLVMLDNEGIKVKSKYTQEDLWESKGRISLVRFDENNIFFIRQKLREQNVIEIREKSTGELVKEIPTKHKAIDAFLIDKDFLIVEGVGDGKVIDVLDKNTNKIMNQIKGNFTQKLLLYGDSILTSSNANLILINKLTSETRTFGEGSKLGIKDFWINEEKKEIISFDWNGKGYCWKMSTLFKGENLLLRSQSRDLTCLQGPSDTISGVM